MLKLKMLAAAVAGYVLMALSIFMALSAAWTALGPEFAFVPGTTRVTWSWLALSTVVSLAAAFVGGSFAVRLAGRRKKAGLYLAGFILVLGYAMAAMQLFAEPPPPPTTEMDATAAAMAAEQPFWYSLVIPLIGVFGVLAGTHFVRSRKQMEAGEAGTP
jgi:hypothetical protein